MVPALRIGIDTGGTFTDVAVLRGTGRGRDARRLEVFKVPSTPDDPARAVLEGLARAGIGAETPVDLVHGTTVGLNAVLTGALARTAWITNAGFVDLCEIGRQDRLGLYDLDPRKPVFPVPRKLRFEIETRRLADGTLEQKATRAAIRTLRDRLAAARIESIAIGLLHAHAHPEDEATIAAGLRKLGLPITCSADLLPVAGEFERFSTAALNAAIAPIVGAYISRLVDGVRRLGDTRGRVRLMRSSGGIMGAEEATAYPARAVFSGPAGGVAAAARIAESLDVARVATLDMGGTSTDVALVDRDGAGEPALASIAGLPLACPAVDVHTIGCGGGSLATVDAGGALRVGPESAGADPGPACYGRGDRPTVTDAHVVLGHLGAETLLGGDFVIQPERSLAAVGALGAKLRMDPASCARGILEVAETAMLRALLVITVERRVDPAALPLVAFGGAGGLHAARLAERLGMSSALIPDHPGALSAVGLALAGESEELIESVLATWDPGAARDVVQRAAALKRTVRGRLSGRAETKCEVRLRFAGQGGGLWVPATRTADADFVAEHARRFGFTPAGRGIEIVALRARAWTPGERALNPVRPAGRRPEPRRRRAPAGGQTWTVFNREEVSGTLEGPALIEETTSVTVVPAGCAARLTAAGLQVWRPNRDETIDRPR